MYYYRHTEGTLMPLSLLWPENWLEDARLPSMERVRALADLMLAEVTLPPMEGVLLGRRGRPKCECGDPAIGTSSSSSSASAIEPRSSIAEANTKGPRNSC
jgi:hypothetical protein